MAKMLAATATDSALLRVAVAQLRRASESAYRMRLGCNVYSVVSCSY